MGENFDVEPADLQGAGTTFATTSGSLREAVARCRATLAGLGDFCGDDEQGRAFAAAYQPKADEVGRALDDAVAALGATGTNLGSAAEQYRSDDTSAQSRMDGAVR